jgi:hypothetical protein
MSKFYFVKTFIVPKFFLCKINFIKLNVRARDMAQVVEHLPSKCDFLNSNSSTTIYSTRKNKEDQN